MPRGGARKGAGRPKGLGKYGEKTTAMRIPLSKVQYVSEIVNKGLHEIPLYANSVSAGFPSPADDYLEEKVDLNQYLVKHPASTFLVRASGESMINAGIFPKDILRMILLIQLLLMMRVKHISGVLLQTLSTTCKIAIWKYLEIKIAILQR